MPNLKVYIYRIYCVDQNIKEFYIGSTTAGNYFARRRLHKCLTHKEDKRGCDSKLYTFMRNNGGWVRWQMEIIRKYDCVDTEAQMKKEREVKDLMNPELNSINPARTEAEKKAQKKKFSSKKNQCNICNGLFTSGNKAAHCNTVKHLDSELDLNLM